MIRAMFGKLGRLFRGKPALVKGTSRLGEGTAKKISFGDVLAGTGKEVVLCRVGGVLYALDAICPHEGGRIAEGPLREGRLAACPLHGYQFDPATGRCVSAACKSSRTYRVRESGEDCEIWL
jgi:nitrite reductase/ring-hydroxylating ferredoxin subunit